MRAYKISPRDFPPAFAPSEAEARATRASLMETYGLKRKDILVEPVEIPTTKAELLRWLNDGGARWV
jgi:hypothetical protein